MEKELAIKDFNSFTIHGWMRTKLNLSGNALMIYSIIFCFSQDNKSAFYGTRQYLSDFIGASRPTVDKALNELCDLGYIIKESVEIKNVVFNNFKINFDILNDVKKYDTYKETLQGCKETLHNDNKEYNKENNFNNINNNTSNKKEIEKEKIKKIYNYFLDKAIYYKYAKTKKNDYDDIPEKQIKAIKKTLDNVDNMDIIIQTIDRYFEVITNKNYFFDTFWNVEKFFGQKNAFDDFLEEGSKWINYKLFKEKQKSYNPYKREEISRETKYPDYDNEGYIY